jgi:hypothetical protein
LLKKLNPPANFRIGVEAHDLPLDRGVRSLACGMNLPSAEGAQMAKPKLSPREIVQRLQMIETLTVEGMPVAEAIRSVGVVQAEYDRWRLEYNGLGRTLGPLTCAPPQLMKTARRVSRARAGKPPK